MVMYSFVHPFCEATFCGVPSCVFDKLGCAASEKMLRNTGIEGDVDKYMDGQMGVCTGGLSNKVMYFWICGWTTC
jgi:hypothetical protein